MSDTRFYCKLYSAVHEERVFTCVYSVRDIEAKGDISIDNKIASIFEGQLEITGSFKHYSDIPTTGTYKEILKHFDLLEGKTN